MNYRLSQIMVDIHFDALNVPKDGYEWGRFKYMSSYLIVGTKQVKSSQAESSSDSEMSI